ncbi:helix-turn-helix domain-containing protein [Streptomyces sp. TRM68367]|uniref:helix-turn-helix domain-containing protein n=1 Tax=Streptomyces sp. TRM68367 TaxID=2758415 RepID=UPI0037DD1BA6
MSWLLDQRIAAAQKLLERTDLPMPEVARRASFGSEVTMRQHFASRLATSPRAYRAAFSTAPVSETAGSKPIAR